MERERERERERELPMEKVLCRCKTTLTKKSSFRGRFVGRRENESREYLIKNLRSPLPTYE
jgi:hypothetical protein